MILLTGSTGFLGRELAARLLRRHPAARLCLLIRENSEHSAPFRARQTFEEIFGSGESERYCERIEVLPGDVTEDCFGLSQAAFNALAGRISSIYHCAATTTLNHDIQTARRVNVAGTFQVLKLAEKCSMLRVHPDFRLFYISTAYVAGARKGIVHTDELDTSGPFRNAYERSKAEAEAMVRSMQNHVPVCIFRPSVIVGDSITGQTSAFNVIYVPAKLLIKGFFSCFPAIPHTPFDIVPVDYVADAIVHLSALSPASGACYHISAGVGRESTPWEIIEHLFSTFNKYRRRERLLLAVPPLVPPEILALAHSSYEAAKSSMKTLERIVCDRINVFRQTLPFIPYMIGNPQFDNSATLCAAGRFLPLPPMFQTYAERLFKYCLDTNWGKLPWTNPSDFPLWRNRVDPFALITDSPAL